LKCLVVKRLRKKKLRGVSKSDRTPPPGSGVSPTLVTLNVSGKGGWGANGKKKRRSNRWMCGGGSNSGSKK